MRVAMVSEHADPLATLGGVDAGGQNVHVAALAAHLGALGDRVVVHTRRDDPTTPVRAPLADHAEVDHVPAGPPVPVPKDELLPYMDEFADRLHEQWRRSPPDVVHAHFWMSGRAALAAADPLGIPVVQTFHALGTVKRRFQGSRDTSPPERIAEERSIVRAVDHIVATCTEETFELAALGAPRSRMSVVPCGVDDRVFRPSGPRQPRRPGTKRIAVVGRLVERKGIDDVITALRRLPGTELLVVGGPGADEIDADPEAGRLLDVARGAGSADQVNFVGRRTRSEVAAVLRSADLLVTVPWYEPFGIVPLEAMACGVPVVASNVGGMLDTVDDGVTGVLVPPQDPEHLARVLASLLDDPGRRAAMGAAGAARVRRYYTWERVARLTRRVYGHAAGCSLRATARTRRARRSAVGAPAMAGTSLSPAAGHARPTGSFG